MEQGRVMHLAGALALLLLLGLAFGIPLSVVHDQPELRLSMEAGLAWLVLAYSSLRLALMALDGRRRILGLTFWIFVYVWLGLAPFAQFTTGEFPLSGAYTTSLAVRSLAIVGVGLLGFEVGYAVLARRLGVAGKIQHVLAARRLSEMRSVWLAIGSCVVGIGLVIGLGGVLGLFVARAELSRRILEIVGQEGQANFLLFVTFLRVPVFLGFFLLLYRWIRGRSFRSVRHSIPLLGLLLLVGAINLLINNPLNSPRYWFGTIVIAPLFLIVPWWRQVSFAALAGGLILLLVVVFPYADVFRVDLDPGLYAGMEWHPITEKSDYDAFQQLMNSVWYVQESGHTFGRQIVGAALFWVPRGLWQGKPIPSGEMVAREAGYRATNLSMPLWGEAYLDGGWPLLALLFVAYGLLIGSLELAHLETRGDGSLLAIVAPLWAAYQVFLLRGALMSALAYLVPIVAFVFLCTRKTRTVVARADEREAA